MADESETAEKDAPKTSTEKSPAESKGARDAKPKRSRRPASAGPAPAKGEKPAAKGAATPKAPRRPTLDPETARLLVLRRVAGRKRPFFGRQQRGRYFRIGRDGAWRRPRGLQSKQRRHYGYRPRVVRIGFGSPAGTRGLTPTGFRPILVHTLEQLEPLTATREAVLIARTVGTRRRLVIEEEARKKGLHVLNPVVRDAGEE